MKLCPLLFAVLLPVSALAINGGELMTEATDPQIRTLYKYTVRLMIMKNEQKGVLMVSEPEWCTGTIIGERTILTAEHCVNGVTGAKAQFFNESGDLVTEILVEYFARKGPSDLVYKMGVSQIGNQLSIDFWPKDSQTDLGIFVLSEKIPPGYEVVEMDLTHHGDDLKQKELIKVGFGISGEVKKRKVGKFKYYLAKDGWIIGWPRTQSDGGICHGDSGGGVFYFENGRPVVISVLSAARGIELEGRRRAMCQPDVQVELASLLSTNHEWLIKHWKKYEGEDLPARSSLR